MDKPEQKGGIGGYPHTRGTPPRVPARMEGKVRQKGIRPVKKKKRDNKG
ncbi:MAG: hypothetical protein G01um10148_584 [Parcubacteria group bacterium Gr01-1014_8]|nr:MAG: hypothetical protein G01um10148_584 [Parcubacteria group bacterium Gr01-1014_8]